MCVACRQDWAEASCWARRPKKHSESLPGSQCLHERFWWPHFVIVSAPESASTRSACIRLVRCSTELLTLSTDAKSWPLPTSALPLLLNTLQHGFATLLTHQQMTLAITSLRCTFGHGIHIVYGMYSRWQMTDLIFQAMNGAATAGSAESCAWCAVR